MVTESNATYLHWHLNDCERTLQFFIELEKFSSITLIGPNGLKYNERCPIEEIAKQSIESIKFHSYYLITVNRISIRSFWFWFNSFHFK